jgi:5'-nucleotidase / UDP-sugar diphosphatase
MRGKKILLALCFIALAGSPATAQKKQALQKQISQKQTLQKQALQKTITILQLNDVYQISPVDKGKRGGMARVATLQKQIRAASPNTLFLIAGDFISPSVASRLFKGKQMVDALNAAGMEIATLGNHEFDFGPDVLRERMKESKFAYTIANVFDKQTGRPFGGASQYIIREMSGVRVAVFGLLLAETATMSNPGPGVRFDDPVAVGARLSRKLRSLGADVIIALTHLPMNEDKRLAAEADLDLIVGGHEHELLQSVANGAAISKMGSDGRNLGRMDLNLVQLRKSRLKARSRRVAFKVLSMDWQAIPVTDSIQDDATVAALVAGYEKELNASLSEVLGKTSVMLDARASTVRFTESNLGNFLADVYRETMGADVAIINGGSIRSDTTYEPGDITKKDVLTILPFENTLVKARITGEHLKRLLENGVSAAGQESGRFPQVSGITFTYDARKPVGSRVVSIEADGKPVEAASKYTIAVSAYVLGGGDGYDFKGAETLVNAESGPVEPDVVMEAIKKRGTISPQVEGRIKSSSLTGRASIFYLRPFRRAIRKAA